MRTQPAAPADQLHVVPRDTFVRHLANVMAVHPEVAANLTAPAELAEGTFYLTTDGASGFGVTWEGELVGLFSTVRGRCADLLDQAVKIGATELNCFDDGRLPGIYARHGFVEYDREPNWTPGGPDVIYMDRGI